MTEQEAIKILTLNKKEQEKLPNLKKVYAVAITALEEIQQYRAIGTVEECREAVEKQKAKKHFVNQVPSRKLPEKMQICGTYPQPDGIVPSYKAGWNACIDAMEGSGANG